MEIKQIKVRLDGQDFTPIYVGRGDTVHFTDGPAPAFVSVFNDELTVVMRRETPFFMHISAGTLFFSGRCYQDREYIYAHLPQPHITEAAAAEVA